MSTTLYATHDGVYVRLPKNLLCINVEHSASNAVTLPEDEWDRYLINTIYAYV